MPVGPCTLGLLSCSDDWKPVQVTWHLLGTLTLEHRKPGTPGTQTASRAHGRQIEAKTPVCVSLVSGAEKDYTDDSSELWSAQSQEQWVWNFLYVLMSFLKYRAWPPTSARPKTCHSWLLTTN